MKCMLWSDECLSGRLCALCKLMLFDRAMLLTVDRRGSYTLTTVDRTWFGRSMYVDLEGLVLYILLCTILLQCHMQNLLLLHLQYVPYPSTLSSNWWLRMSTRAINCSTKKTTTTTTTQCKLQYYDHHHICQKSICACWP